MANPIVLIPARMAATRLPRKAARRHSRRADDRPRVAAGDGGGHRTRLGGGGRSARLRSGRRGGRHGDHDPRPIITSGSDRIFEALGAVDADGAHDVVVNIQGDLPTIEPSVVRACLAPLAERAVDIATLATPITREQEKDDPNVVKVVATELGPTRLRALYFTRARAPWGEGRLLHHIGLYAYRREALESICRLAAFAA